MWYFTAIYIKFSHINAKHATFTKQLTLKTFVWVLWGVFLFFYCPRRSWDDTFLGRHLDQPCHHEEGNNVSLPTFRIFKENGTQNELELSNLDNETQRNEKRADC